MVSSIMSHSKIKCRLDHLTQQLIDLIQVRWNNQLASDLKVTICDCLRVLGSGCPPDTVSVEKRKVLIKQIYNLLIQRVGTGFQFDEAPSAVSNRLYYFTASDSKAAINARPSILGGGGKASPVDRRELLRSAKPHCGWLSPAGGYYLHWPTI